jgi:hypothetical protein
MPENYSSTERPRRAFASFAFCAIFIAALLPRATASQ